MVHVFLDRWICFKQQNIIVGIQFCKSNLIPHLKFSTLIFVKIVLSVKICYMLMRSNLHIIPTKSISSSFLTYFHTQIQDASF